MPTRVITATVTSGSMADKPAGTYVTFGEINSDTGVVERATVKSATLYLSSYKTYTIYGALNVIFGDNSGTIVATTNELEKDTAIHSGTHELHNLSEALLTSEVEKITLGVIADIGTDSDRINIRDGCTLTLTIEYELNHRPVGYYTNSEFVECVLYWWNGEAWIECEAHYQSGAAFILTDYDGAALTDSDAVVLSST